MFACSRSPGEGHLLWPLLFNPRMPKGKISGDFVGTRWGGETFILFNGVFLKKKRSLEKRDWMMEMIAFRLFSVHITSTFSIIVLLFCCGRKTGRYATIRLMHIILEGPSD